VIYPVQDVNIGLTSMTLLQGAAIVCPENISTCGGNNRISFEEIDQ
jgi:hypothetical protein